MKILFLAAIAATALAAPSMAADIPVKARPQVVAPPYSWTGCYLGAMAGYRWGRHKQEYGGTRAGVPDAFLPVGFDVTGNYRVDGAIAGGTAGCNWQSGRFVLGIEADGAVSGGFGAAYPTPGAVAAGANPSRQFTSENRWTTTFRGRLGYTLYERWLVYVTGGGTYGEFVVNNHAAIVAANANRIPDRVRRLGWTAGFGSEWALGDRWSVKTEVLYSKYGSFHYTDTPAANNCVQCYSMNVKMQEIVFHAGFNYRFDWMR